MFSGRLPSDSGQPSGGEGERHYGQGGGRDFWALNFWTMTDRCGRPWCFIARHRRTDIFSMLLSRRPLFSLICQKENTSVNNYNYQVAAACPHCRCACPFFLVSVHLFINSLQCSSDEQGWKCLMEQKALTCWILSTLQAMWTSLTRYKHCCRARKAHQRFSSIVRICWSRFSFHMDSCLVVGDSVTAGLRGSSITCRLFSGYPG